MHGNSRATALTRPPVRPGTLCSARSRLRPTASWQYSARTIKMPMRTRGRRAMEMRRPPAQRSAFHAVRRALASSRHQSLGGPGRHMRPSRSALHTSSVVSVAWGAGCGMLCAVGAATAPGLALAVNCPDDGHACFDVLGVLSVLLERGRTGLCGHIHCTAAVGPADARARRLVKVWAMTVVLTHGHRLEHLHLQ